MPAAQESLMHLSLITPTPGHERDAAHEWARGAYLSTVVCTAERASPPGSFEPGGPVASLRGQGTGQGPKAGRAAVPLNSPAFSENWQP